MNDERSQYPETHGERRARKLKAKREQMQQHGVALRRNLPDAALRMARKRVRRVYRKRSK